MASLAGGIAQGLGAGMKIGSMYSEMTREEDDFARQKRDREDADYIRGVGPGIESKAPAAPADPGVQPVGIEQGVDPEFAVSGVDKSGDSGIARNITDKSGDPQFKMLESYDQMVKRAIERKRPDLAQGAFKESLKLRTELINHNWEEAQRTLTASGGTDWSGFKKVYGLFRDGNDFDLEGTQDGKVKATITRADGSKVERVASKEEALKLLNGLRDPAAVAKAEADRLQETFKSDLKIKEKKAEEEAKGIEARKTEETKQGREEFTHAPGGDNHAPLIYNKRTGRGIDGRPVGGGPKPGGFNPKELPIHKEIGSLITDAPGMMEIDEGGNKTLTKDGMVRRNLGVNLYQYNPGPNGERMSPNEAAMVATQGEYDPNNPEIMQDGDRFYAVPVVRYNGRVLFADDPRRRIDVTDQVRARQTQGAPGQPGVAPTQEPAPVGIERAAPAGASPITSLPNMSSRNPAHRRKFEELRARGQVEAGSIEELQEAEATQGRAAEAQRTAIYQQKQQLAKQIVDAQRSGDMARAKMLMAELKKLNGAGIAQ